MKNKIFTTGEILTIKTNLREIEKNLGGPIPGGVIDVDDLKDHILRPGEVVTVCSNLRALNKRDSSYKGSTPYGSKTTPGSAIKAIIFLLAVSGIIFIIEKILGLTIL